ncbi:hypothetical protein [Lysinibacillus parviboronicapiens]|uniref:Secreted protein n=1 Tax=Lysinibacillus parviboronicapiens TaxID=436516 RepID=A0ABV2PFW2_9BACI|nr:hypothetical protein [Lysinibacillus parviboronicapiens]
MRIVGLVCYFLGLFYGVEPVLEEFTAQEPTIHFPVVDKQQTPIKETVENAHVCVHYPTYKVCTALSKK